MRRGMSIWLVVLLIIGALAIGVGAYNFGVSQGLEETGRAAEVVRVVGHGGGFFPFGFFLFPLFFIGLFFLIRAAFWGRGGPGRWGPGPWGGGPGSFEDWHRRQHEESETRNDQPREQPGSSPESQ